MRRTVPRLRRGSALALRARDAARGFGARRRVSPGTPGASWRPLPLRWRRQMRAPLRTRLGPRPAPPAFATSLHFHWHAAAPLATQRARGASTAAQPGAPALSPAALPGIAPRPRDSMRRLWREAIAAPRGAATVRSREALPAPETRILSTVFLRPARVPREGPVARETPAPRPVARSFMRFSRPRRVAVVPIRSHAQMHAEPAQSQAKHGRIAPIAPMWRRQRDAMRTGAAAAPGSTAPVRVPERQIEGSARRTASPLAIAWPARRDFGASREAPPGVALRFRRAAEPAPHRAGRRGDEPSFDGGKRRREERVSLLVERRVALAWRTQEAGSTAAKRATIHEQEQSERSAATAAAAAHVQSVEAAAVSAKAAARAMTLDAAFVDRLAEDVMRRMERRVRIERERRGL